MYDIATVLKKHINRLLAEAGTPDKLISKPIIVKAVEAVQDDIAHFIARQWIYRLTDAQLKQVTLLKSPESIKAALLHIIDTGKKS